MVIIMLAGRFDRYFCATLKIAEGLVEQWCFLVGRTSYMFIHSCCSPWMVFISQNNVSKMKCFIRYKTRKENALYRSSTSRELETAFEVTLLTRLPQNDVSWRQSLSVTGSRIHAHFIVFLRLIQGHIDARGSTTE